MFTALAELAVEGEFDTISTHLPRRKLICYSARGTAITFFTTNDAKQARDLLTVLREAKQQIPPELADMSRSGFGGGGGRYGSSRGRGGRGGGGGGKLLR